MVFKASEQKKNNSERSDVWKTPLGHLYLVKALLVSLKHRRQKRKVTNLSYPSQDELK